MPQYTNNAVWLGHGWLGDNGWFERNKRKKADFRSKEKISALFKKLSNCKIKTVYPHLCPAQMNGKIAACDNEQFARFLDLAEQYNIKRKKLENFFLLSYSKRKYVNLYYSG